MSNYTHVDDCPELEKFADLVTLNLRHDFTPEELAQESQMLAQSVNDKIHEENNKKVAMTVFKNKIETFDADIKLHASNLTHGFTYVDKSCEMYRDWKAAKRVYFDKQSGIFVREEPFHPSDYQKKLEFEAEYERLRLEDEARQQQIDENNRAGMYAEGEEQNLDALDGVILAKKIGKRGKPTPKDNLHPNHGRDAEEPELPEDDIFAPIKEG